MTYDLGIDIGTSYTAAATCCDGAVDVVGLGPIADNIPTVIYLAEDGSLVVGDAANRRAVIDPSGAAREFKRRMGDPTPVMLRTSPFSPESLYGRTLEAVLQRVTERQGEPPGHVVVTHPANWGAYKLELLDQALQMVDAKASKATEPEAAALAYASQRRVAAGSVVAVYDLGGGTFDAAVLRKLDNRFELLGDPVGIEHLGGIDFDEAVFQHARRELGNRWPADPRDPALHAPMLHLRRNSVEAKELLSTELEAHIAVLLPGVDATVVITRAQFERMITPRLEDTVVALQSALDKAGVGAQQLSSILLVGGSSRIPLVASILRDRFGEIVASDIDPLYAVARGAAVIAGERGAASRAAASSRGAVGAPVEPADRPRPAAHDDALGGAATGAVATGAAVAGTETVDRGTDGGRNEDAPRTRRRSRRRPRSRRELIVDALLAVLILGTGTLIYVKKRSGSSASASEGATTTSAVVLPTSVTNAAASTAAASTAPGSTKPGPAPGAAVAVAVPAGAGMVLIPAGQYKVGADPADTSNSESTARTLPVAAFYLDTTEVTNARFKQFIDSAQAAEPLRWTNANVDDKHKNLPVVGVNYDWAKAFCQSSGKRLPTELEWEVAARGPAGLDFPWGAKVIDIQEPLLESSGYYPVGSVAANKSAFGVYDLTGNAWEWVADTYEKNKTFGPGEQVVRGGSNGFLRKNSIRLPVNARTSNIISQTGFRCAADKVDETATPTFGAYERPEAPATPPPPPPLPAGVAFIDDFHDVTSGWIEHNEATSRSGYHPNSFFHCEVKAAGATVEALAPYVPQSGKPVAVEATMFMEQSLTNPAGTYSVGLIFGYNPKDQSGYAFLVSAEDWKIVRLGQNNTLAAAEYSNARSTNVIKDVTLSVDETTAGTFAFAVNGQPLTTQALGATGNQVGLVLSSGTSEKAHLHVKSFQVKVHG